MKVSPVSGAPINLCSLAAPDNVFDSKRSRKSVLSRESVAGQEHSIISLVQVGSAGLLV